MSALNVGANMSKKNVKLLNKYRGKKLIGIKKIPTDPYCDDDLEGFILTFSNGVELDFYADRSKIIIEQNTDKP